MPDATHSPPVAPAKPLKAPRRRQRVTHHGITLTDDYAWLRDPAYPKVEDPAILAHLAAENAWFEARMAPHAQLVETLFQEMKGRIKEDDSSVPQRYGDFLYWVKFEEGAQYPQHYRRSLAAPGDGSADELLLDEVALAAGHEYFRLGQLAVTRDGRLLAYAADTDGSERFTIRFKDLATGVMLPDEIPGTLGNIEWVEGDRALAYAHANANWRTDSIRLHRLGSPVASDIELYHEDDDGFRAEASLSAQEDWLIIASGDHETSEVRLVPAADPTADPILVRPRQQGVEYDVDVRDGTVWVHTNDEHVNFRLATAPLERPGDWRTVLKGSDAFYLSGFRCSRTFSSPRGGSPGSTRCGSTLTTISRPNRSPFPKRAMSRAWATIPNMRSTGCGCPTRAWSPRARSTTIMSRPASSSCSSGRRSPAVITRRSIPPSG
jgi:oligopeptidase B